MATNIRYGLIVQDPASGCVCKQPEPGDVISPAQAGHMGYKRLVSGYIQIIAGVLGTLVSTKCLVGYEMIPTAFTKYA